MNWEGSVLNRIYKTLDFKINPPNYNKLAQNAKLSVIEKNIEKLTFYELNNDKSLFNLNIRTNSNCALYQLNFDRSTFYYSIYINWYFNTYTEIFNLGRKYIETNTKENNKNEIELLYKWEKYFLHLLFLKEFDEKLFITEIKGNLNIHFQFSNFILKNFSYYDVVLLSLIYNTNIYHKIFQEKNNEALYFRRWLIYTHEYLSLDDNKLIAYYNSKARENQFETYKLTSSQEIVNAVINKEYEKVNNLLSKDHENVNSRKPKDFKTLAHIACSQADKKCLQILLDYKCDMESFDFENMTPLYDGIYSKNIEFVDYLLSSLHLNLHHKEIQNRTPFYWAACVGDVPMLKYLLTKNVDINGASSMGRTPLSKACWNGRIDIVKILCEQKGIIIDCPDKNGRYPLHNAVWGEYGGRQGKKMNGGMSSDSPQAAQYLIQFGANVEVKDNEGDTPFMIASSTNGIESIKVLAKAGANVNNVNNKGESALIQATQYGNWESVGTLLDLIKNEKLNIDLEIRDHDGNRAIEHAIVYKRVILLKMLFEFDNRYDNVDDIINLGICCVKAESFLSFEYLTNRLKQHSHEIKNELFNELIIRILVLEEINFFNCLYENFEDKINELFCENGYLQSLILACCLSKVFINNHRNDSNEEENEYEEEEKKEKEKEDEKDKTNLEKKSEEEDEMEFDKKNKLYEKIISMKMSELDEKLSYLIDKDFENENSTFSQKEISKFTEKISKAILYVTDFYFNKNKNPNESLIKLLIISDKKDIFSNIINPLKNQSINFTKDTIIRVDQKFFEKFQTGKHSFGKVNNYSKSIINESISFFNSNNILSLSIESPEDSYFNELIKLPQIKKQIFEYLPLNKKNILHILFKEELYKSKFLKILELIKEEFSTQKEIEQFLLKINEPDIFSVTPLDILLKNKNCDLIEEYTKYLNDLENQYLGIKGPIEHQITHYTISNFIISSKEKAVNKDFKEYIIRRLKENQQILNSKKKSELSFEDLYKICLYNINDSTINYSTEIVKCIKNEMIEKKFVLSDQNYNHIYIDTPELLKKVCEEELSSEEVLGVDAEFDGISYEKDGIVCLIQISTMKCSYAIDCLKLRDEITLYLKPIFENEKILKVFHGCDNDIFWILANFDIYTKNIYDTARSFIVYQNIILNKIFKIDNLPSLYYLVKFFMNVKLDKSYQKSNWKIRPLTKNMLQYAFNDAKSVLYLYYIFQGLFMYLNKYQYSDEIKKYYTDIHAKFFENRENISIMKKEIPQDKLKSVLITISYKCLEMVKSKIKDYYIKHEIKLK